MPLIGWGTPLCQELRGSKDLLFHERKEEEEEDAGPLFCEEKKKEKYILSLLSFHIHPYYFLFLKKFYFLSLDGFLSLEVIFQD